MTNAPKPTTQARALDAYLAVTDLADGLDSTLAALQSVRAAPDTLARTCRALSRAVVFLAKKLKAPCK
ncbi:hypothetical protein [Streptomyces olivoreticuli]|uniref:hypothetical protein n=1 Tax=Streptomyces olivoreticuli TaxID=68246 RepID=UPI000E277FD5|nr:hypothetical protein [Streptomyces olivoreticuli]